MDSTLLPSSLESLLTEELPKEAAKIDEENSVPYDFWEKLREMGFFSACLPRELGGLGLGFSGLVELARLSGRSSMAVAAVGASHMAVALLVYRHGGELAVELLPRMATGELVAAVAITELGGGTDLASSIKAECRMEKDLCLVSGEKVFVTAATYAGIFLVLVRSKGEWRSILVPRSGNMTVEKLPLVVFRGAGTSRIMFDKVRVPRKNVLEGDGLKISLEAINTGRLAYAAAGLGAAEGLLRYAVLKADKRKLFGKRLLDMQGIRWKLAELYVKTRTVGSLLKATAKKADDEGYVDPEEAAVAKISASELASDTAVLARQLDGGRGFMEGSLPERMVRDSSALGVGEGATEALLDFISRALERKTLSR